MANSDYSEDFRLRQFLTHEHTYTYGAGTFPAAAYVRPLQLSPRRHLVRCLEYNSRAQ